MSDFLGLENRLRKKAIKHPYCRYHVVAIGLSKKNDIIDIMTNKPATKQKTFNTHAECRMMLRYGRKLKQIMIARFGANGDKLPIKPCPQCAALALSYGINICSMEED